MNASQLGLVSQGQPLLVDAQFLIDDDANGDAGDLSQPSNARASQQGRSAASGSMSSSVQQELTRTYETFADLYPNPRLVEEARERDTLIQASSAASHAKFQSSKPKPKSGGGFFSFLFGSSAADDASDANQRAGHGVNQDDDNNDGDDDGPIIYIEPSLDDVNDSVCGTSVGLDTSCIPDEAHSVARFQMASAKTHGAGPNVARQRVDIPANTVDGAPTPTHVIVGLGTIAEIDADGNPSLVLHTRDRDRLLDFANHAPSSTPFRLQYARAATLSNHCIAISWGFGDGIIVIYHKLLLDGHLLLEPMTYCKPSPAVVDNLEGVGGTFLDDGDHHSGSPLILVTDMIPLTVDARVSIPAASASATGQQQDTNGNDPAHVEMQVVPLCTLAVSRLGGYIELMPLPPPMITAGLLTPETYPLPKWPKIKRNAHYAMGLLRDDIINGIVALTTNEYHSDIVCLSAFRTCVDPSTTWNNEDYPDGPPAEFVLAATGSGESGHATVTFWSVGTTLKKSLTDVAKQGQDDPNNGGGSGGQMQPQQAPIFHLHATLSEAITTPTGADASIFATRRIANRWRAPRKVELKPDIADATAEGSPSISAGAARGKRSAVVTSITTSSPIVAMKFSGLTDEFHHDTPKMAIMDCNGGLTILDCGALDRFASQTLTVDEYSVFRRQDDTTDAFPLVVTVTSRSQFLHRMLKVTKGKPPNILSFAWQHYQHSDDGFGAEESTEVMPSIACLCAAPRALIICPLSQLPSDLPEMQMQASKSSQSIALVKFPKGTCAAMIGLRQNIAFFMYQRASNASCKQLRAFALQHLNPFAVVQLLATSGRHADAIQAAEQLSATERSELDGIIQQCHRSLWETDKDIRSLSQCTDLEYIFQQTNSALMGEPQDNKTTLEGIRDVCKVALHVTAQFDDEASRQQQHYITDCLIRLGSYELLCQLYGAAPLTHHFQKFFVSQNITDLAVHFAKEGDILALTIIMFRHKHDFVTTLQLLSSLPISIDPQIYCHLLPVAVQFTVDDHFMPDYTEEYQPKHISLLPQYMVQKHEVALVNDTADEKMVLAARSALSSATETSDAAVLLLEWCIQRVADTRLLVGSDLFAYQLCEIGINCVASLRSDIQQNPALIDLHKCLQSSKTEIESLRSVVEIGVTDDVASSVESHVALLDSDAVMSSSEDTPDLVETLVRTAQELQRMDGEASKTLRPLLEKAFAVGSDTFEGDVDAAIALHCQQLLSRCFDVKNNRFGSDDDVIAQVMQSLRTSALIVCASSTALTKEERLIREKEAMAKLTIRLIHEYISLLVDVAVPSSDVRNILDLFWQMYESLPASLPSELSGDEVWIAIGGKMNGVYRSLICLDIFLRWPTCNAFDCASMLSSPTTSAVHDGKEIAGNIAVTSTACARLCQAFLSQVDIIPLDDHLLIIPSLLNDLLSDIEEMFVAANGTLEGDRSRMVKVICDALVRPLLEREAFQIAHSIIKSLQSSGANIEAISNQVLCFLHEAIYDDGHMQDRLYAAQICQDVLCTGLLPPNATFAQMKRHMDASNFIHSSLLPGAQGTQLMPGDIQTMAPLDVVSKAIVQSSVYHILDGNWQTEAESSQANQQIRDGSALGSADHASHDGFRDGGRSTLLPPPEKKTLVLCKILDIGDADDIFAAKMLLVNFLLNEESYGAVAAMCRTFIRQLDIAVNTRDLKCSTVIHVTASIVGNAKYEDVWTKAELCQSLLSKLQGVVISSDGSDISVIRDVHAKLMHETSVFSTAMAKQRAVRPPDRPIVRAFHHTQMKYGSDIHALFTDLSMQGAEGMMHDALLDTLCRLLMYWCISESLRPRLYVNVAETIDLREVLALSVAIMFHIPSSKTAKLCKEELQKTLKGEADKVATIKRFSRASHPIVPKADLVAQLQSRGYSENGAKRALIATGGRQIDVALRWAIEHSMDKNFNNPIVHLRKIDDPSIDSVAIQDLRLALVDKKAPVVAKKPPPPLPPAATAANIGTETRTRRAPPLKPPTQRAQPKPTEAEIEAKTSVPVTKTKAPTLLKQSKTEPPAKRSLTPPTKLPSSIESTNIPDGQRKTTSTLQLPKQIAAPSKSPSVPPPQARTALNLKVVPRAFPPSKPAPATAIVQPSPKTAQTSNLSLSVSRASPRPPPPAASSQPATPHTSMPSPTPTVADATTIRSKIPAGAAAIASKQEPQKTPTAKSVDVPRPAPPLVTSRLVPPSPSKRPPRLDLQSSSATKPAGSRFLKLATTPVGGRSKIPSSSPSSREELKSKGLRLFQTQRKEPSPTNERQRLLSQGHQLFLKSRQNQPKPPSGLRPASRLQLPSKAGARPSTTGSPSSSLLSVSRPSPPPRPLSKLATPKAASTLTGTTKLASRISTTAGSAGPAPPPPPKPAMIGSTTNKPTVQKLSIETDDGGGEDTGWGFDDFDDF